MGLFDDILAEARKAAEAEAQGGRFDDILAEARAAAIPANPGVTTDATGMALGREVAAAGQLTPTAAELAGNPEGTMVTREAQRGVLQIGAGAAGMSGNANAQILIDSERSDLQLAAEIYRQLTGQEYPGELADPREVPDALIRQGMPPETTDMFWQEFETRSGVSDQLREDPSLRADVEETALDRLTTAGRLGGQADAIPHNPTAQRFIDTWETTEDGWGPALRAIASDPAGALAMFTEEALQDTPSAAVAAMGAPFGPAVVGGVLGLGNAAQEYDGVTRSWLQERGIDLSKPEDAERLLDSPELLREAQERGVTKAVITGAIEGLIPGEIGSRLARSVFGQRVVDTVAEGAAGGAADAAGTAAIGDPFSPKSVIQEALGEAPTGAVEGAIAQAASSMGDQGTQRTPLGSTPALPPGSPKIQRDPRMMQAQDLQGLGMPKPDLPTGNILGVAEDGRGLTPTEISAAATGVSTATDGRPLSAAELAGAQMGLKPTAATEARPFGLPEIQAAGRRLGPADIASPIPTDLIGEGYGLLDQIDQNNQVAPRPAPEPQAEAAAQPLAGAPQAQPAPSSQEVSPPPAQAPAAAPTPEADDVWEQIPEEDDNGPTGRMFERNRETGALRQMEPRQPATAAAPEPKAARQPAVETLPNGATVGRDTDGRFVPPASVPKAARPVTQRTPALQEAARKVAAGEMTQAEYQAVVDREKPVTPYESVPEPASREQIQAALTEDKVGRVGAPDLIEEGRPVGLRLDIPAYRDKDTWVVSVHDQGSGFAAGPSIGYSSVARARDVTMGMPEKAALSIAQGKPKGTIATMKGSWVRTTPEQAKADADAALSDPAWVQVGMDPERHSFFYDRRDQRPIVAADEVIQIGPLVLAKNPTYGEASDYRFAKPDQSDNTKQEQQLTGRSSGGQTASENNQGAGSENPTPPSADPLAAITPVLQALTEAANAMSRAAAGQAQAATDEEAQAARRAPKPSPTANALREGTEDLAPFGVENSIDRTTGKRRKGVKAPTTREVAGALQQRQRARAGVIERGDYSKSALERIAKWMVEEVLFSVKEAILDPAKSAVGWYSVKFQKALDTFAGAFPELRQDGHEAFDRMPGAKLLQTPENARAFYTAIIAITSDGNEVSDNLNMAADVYAAFRRTGRLDPSLVYGQRIEGMTGNFRKLENLLRRHGPEKMHGVLLREDTVSNLAKRAREEGEDFSSEYLASMRLPFAALVFGPKLGAFYANLMGRSGYLTMDRWWSRTFNRYRGTLLQEPTRQGLDRFKELLAREQRRNSPWQEISDADAILATVPYRNAYSDRKFKHDDSVPANVAEIEKAANTIWKAAFSDLEDSPFNGSDRKFMVDAAKRTKTMLARQGVDLTIADIQAVLWYYEKRLYGEMGARQTKDIAYGDIARQVVERLLSPGGMVRPGRSGDPDDGDAGVSGEGSQGPAGDRPRGRRPAAPKAARAGRDAGGSERVQPVRPLPGAPRKTLEWGPDPVIVAAAEAYARDHGIALGRQAHYAKADPERGARIAQAYEEMAHAPQDPRVKAAFAELIRQTREQYDYLVRAGIRFTFYGNTNDPYETSPWAALRDLRENRHMAVYSTAEGYGTSQEQDLTDNPMLEDTGLRWPMHDDPSDLRVVYANDLFRAVHDTFGHSLEGVGFRADGEENAWQAHVRLFTGAAVGAMTSETRGQNSWLNFGPYGEANQTAGLFETHFADQKTGLMPSWTWTEGRVPDMEPDYERSAEDPQDPRATPQAGRGLDGRVPGVPGGSRDEGAGGSQAGRVLARVGQAAAPSLQLVTAEDLLALDDPEALRAFLRRPGWAALTAAIERSGPPYDRFPEMALAANERENQRLRTDLRMQGIPFVEVEGVYKGEKDGTSFLIVAPEEKAITLGRRYLQESVLTHEGLIYAVRPAPRTPASGSVMVGPEARAQDFYSVLPSGAAFSMDLDFSQGPGVPTLPFGYRFDASRPQLPIRPDGLAELYHWSHKDLASVDPSFAGTGPLEGEERRRGAKFSFFGVNPKADQRAPGTGYVKESGLGDNLHMGLIEPRRLYPFFEDPDGIAKGTLFAAEEAIRRAGYAGYYLTDDGNVRSPRAPLGNVAVLFEPLPVERVAEPKAARAYHGTHARFDRFSTDFIMSGEGAVVYGWGLYFASKRSISEWYRKSVSERHGLSSQGEILLDGAPLPDWFKKSDHNIYLPGEDNPWIERSRVSQLQPPTGMLRSGHGAKVWSEWASRPMVMGGITYLERSASQMMQHITDILGFSLQSGMSLDSFFAQYLPGPFKQIDDALKDAQAAQSDYAREMLELKALDAMVRLSILQDLQARMAQGKTEPGSLFTVEVPEPEEMFDWDRSIHYAPDAVKAKILPELQDIVTDALQAEGQGSQIAFDIRTALNIFGYVGIDDTVAEIGAARGEDIHYLLKSLAREGHLANHVPDAPETQSFHAAVKLARELTQQGVREYGRAQDKLLKQADVLWSAAASLWLKWRGVPGHYYADASSRNRDGLSKNFVIYDEERIQILAREARAYGSAWMERYEEGLRGGLGGGVNWSIRPQVIDAIDAMNAEIQAYLQKVGLGDAIKASAVEDLFMGVNDPIEGVSYRNIILVALNSARSTGQTVRHETIHAIRSPEIWGLANGLFRQEEWDALVTAALADPDLMADVASRYDEAKMGRDAFLEEAVAMLYEKWHLGRLKAEPKGFLLKALEKIRDLLAALREAMNGQGLLTADQIFEAIETGGYGRRASSLNPVGEQGEPRASQPRPLWYSALEAALAENPKLLKVGKAKAQEWMSLLRSAPGVKMAELDWIGLPEWMEGWEGATIPREDLLTYVRDQQVALTEAWGDADTANPFVNVAVVGSREPQDGDIALYEEDAREQLGEEASDDEIWQLAYNMAMEAREDTSDALAEDTTSGRAWRGAYNHVDETWEFDGRAFETQREAELYLTGKAMNDTGRFGSHHEPHTEDGGQNYRELLIRVPDLHLSGKNKGGSRRPFVERAHFYHENIVAHVRMTDRVDGQGRKVLFVEEIQSDLASKWREATASQEQAEEARALDERMNALTARITAARLRARQIYPEVLKALGYETVSPDNGQFFNQILKEALFEEAGRPHPLAAFPEFRALAVEMAGLEAERGPLAIRRLQLGTIKTVDPSTPRTPYEQELSYQLAVRRLMRVAADEGYEALAWTPGWMQAERWGRGDEVIQTVSWQTTPDGRILVALRHLENGTDNVTVRGREDAEAVASLTKQLGEPLVERILSEQDGEARDLYLLPKKPDGSSSGYAVAYDQQVKKAVEGFAKKYGGRAIKDGSLMERSLSDGSLKAIIGAISAAPTDVLLEAWDKISDAVEPSYAAATDATARRVRDGHLSPAYLRARLQREDLYLALAEAMGIEVTLTPPRPVWAIEITEEMRDAASQAQPKFARPLSPPVQRRALGAMPTSPSIPDRSVWRELTNASAPIWDRLRGGIGAVGDHVDRVRFLLQDQMLPLKRAQRIIEEQLGGPLPREQNAYLAETLYSGKVGRHLFEIDQGFTKPILKLIGDAKGLSLEAVEDYLYARHAEERNDEIARRDPSFAAGQGSGMTTAEARAKLAAAHAGPNAGTLRRIGALVDRLRDRSLQVRVDSGLMSQADANQWKATFKHYVPLRGFADLEFTSGSAAGKSYNVTGAESKAATGRTSRAFNVLQMAITEAQEAAIRAEKNVVARALYELVTANPADAMWQVKPYRTQRYLDRKSGLVKTRSQSPKTLFQEGGELGVKINGDEHRIILVDPRLRAALEGMDAGRLDVATRIARWGAQLFSATRTMLNPAFVVVNAARDFLAANVNISAAAGTDANKIRWRMAKTWGSAFMGSWRGLKGDERKRWAQHFRDWQRVGGSVSFWGLEDNETGAADLQRRLRIQRGSALSMATAPFRLSVRDNPVLGTLERLNLAVDNATRLSAFVAARDLGWDVDEAAALSKNLTVNFNRKGAWGKVINSYFPFFNAAIQGSQVMAKALVSSRAVKGIVLAGVAAGFTSDQINANLSDVDPTGELVWDMIPDFQLQRNLRIMGSDGETAWGTPLPYGYNIFPYIGAQASKVMRGVKEPGEALADSFTAIASAWSPISGSDPLTTVSPYFLDPAIELLQNRNYRDAPIYPRFWNEAMPDSQQFFPSASQASQGVARFLNGATGGDGLNSGVIDLSPETIDYWMAYVTGGLGTFGGQVVDMIAKVAEGKAAEIEIADTPILRTVRAGIGDWTYADRFYTFSAEVEQAVSRIKAWEEDRSLGTVARRDRRLATLADSLRAAQHELRGQGDWNPNSDSPRRARDPVLVYQSFIRRYLAIMGPQAE